VRRLVLAGALLALAAGCAHRGAVPTPTETGGVERGEASWYGEPYHGRRTASGEVYDMHEMTAAHRTLPFGTVVRVERRDTGAGVEVRVNDRGPFVKGRIIDLSYAAARVIGLDVDGVAPVKLRVLGRTAVARAESTPVETDDDHCWWVQVGAFSDRANARRVRERLLEAGEKAVVLEGADGLDRVRVGPFVEEEAARAAALRLAGEWPGASALPCGG
jgi:rare lipoprotein A